MLWQNIDEYYSGMDPLLYLAGIPTNMACHNICKHVQAPVGAEHLLGLGAKYCVKKTKLEKKPIEKMMKRLRNSVRWKYKYRGEPPGSDEGRYIPGLHINSDIEPKDASDRIEECMNNFEKAVKVERKRRKHRHIVPNLTPT